LRGTEIEVPSTVSAFSKALETLLVKVRVCVRVPAAPFPLESTAKRASTSVLTHLHRI